ncbi:hypothetical protein AAFP30_05530 [Gordonia sp. CPCC 205515]
MPTPNNNNNRKPNTPAAPQRRRRRVRKFDQRSHRWTWVWQ